MIERTPCEEYGHIYKTVWDFRLESPGIYKVCDDCGDEYEVNIDEL